MTTPKFFPTKKQCNYDLKAVVSHLPKALSPQILQNCPMLDECRSSVVFRLDDTNVDTVLLPSKNGGSVSGDEASVPEMPEGVPARARAFRTKLSVTVAGAAESSGNKPPGGIGGVGWSPLIGSGVSGEYEAAALASDCTRANGS